MDTKITRITRKEKCELEIATISLDVNAPLINDIYTRLEELEYKCHSLLDIIIEAKGEIIDKLKSIINNYETN